jgi:hypothetical protein
MRRWRAAILPVAWGMLGVFERPAVASDRCPPGVVEAEAGVRARWPELPDRVRELFAGRDDLDACARVALRLNGGSIAVKVTLPDGRSAARSVSRQEDVLPVVEALLLVPERERPVDPLEPDGEPATPTPAAPALAARAPSRPSVRAETTRHVPDRDRSSGWAANTPDRLRVELSVAPGARLGDGQLSVGLGACSFLDVGGWLAGFEGRIDQYQKIGGGSEAATLELAAQGGRRLRFQTLALDFSAGPALVLQGTATEETEYGPGGPKISESSSSTVLRLLVGTRLSFSARSALRPFVGVDGEFGPERAPGADLPRDAPRLPLWTVGLALGASVGTP